jgi:hypothetical protein
MGGYCDGVWEDIVMGYGRILWWGMGGYCDGVWEDIVFATNNKEMIDIVW